MNRVSDGGVHYLVVDLRRNRRPDFAVLLSSLRYDTTGRRGRRQRLRLTFVRGMFARGMNDDRVTLAPIPLTIIPLTILFLRNQGVREWREFTQTRNSKLGTRNLKLETSVLGVHHGKSRGRRGSQSVLQKIHEYVRGGNRLSEHQSVASIAANRDRPLGDWDQLWNSNDYGRDL